MVTETAQMRMCRQCAFHNEKGLHTCESIDYKTLYASAPSDLHKDAARYRWLRMQTWHAGRLAVVANPKDALKLGQYAPSGELLDAAIDQEMTVHRSK